jgi:hypothetical protein
VGGSAIEIHAPGIYVSGDLDYVIERTRQGTTQVDDILLERLRGRGPNE